MYEQTQIYWPKAGIQQDSWYILSFVKDYQSSPLELKELLLICHFGPITPCGILVL